jgi:membrane protease YdiL (CAAX protease family)
MFLRLAHPGLLLAAGLALMVIGLQTVISVPLYAVDAILSKATRGAVGGLVSDPLAMGIINLLAFTGPVWLALHLNRLRFKEAFPCPTPRVFQVVGVLMVSLACVFLISDVDNLMRRLVPVPQWFAQMMDSFVTKGAIVSRVFLLVIVAPLTEELLFRGLLLRGLLTRHSPVVAVAVSSFLFAFIHLNPWQFVSAFLLGLALGWFFLRTGSVWMCILGHAIGNGTFLVASLIETKIPGFNLPAPEAQPEFQPWWMDLSAAFVLALGIWVFRCATRNPPPLDPEAPPVIVENPSVPPLIPPVIQLGIAPPRPTSLGQANDVFPSAP